MTQPDFRKTARPRFLSLLNVERKQALDRQKKREDLLEDTEHGSKILGLHQDLQAPGRVMGDWGFMVLSPEDSAVTGSHRQSPEALADVLDERVESKLSANEKARSLASSDVVSNTRQFLPSCSIIFYSSLQ